MAGKTFTAPAAKCSKEIMANSDVRIFGIRHHGPGSARSLRQALEAWKPDCLLIEGPPDAAESLPLMLHEEMQPPVALLGYIPDQPKRAAYYPFAVFSPEWQALQYGLKNKINVAFMDLPLANQFALEDAELARLAEVFKAAPPPPSTPAADSDETGDDHADTPTAPDKLAPPDFKVHPRHDPLRWLAEAAGYSDGERWWEHMVEQRRDGADLFGGIIEAMSALRKELPELESGFEARRENLREAHMRSGIRAAISENYKRIAIVCGAWHAPVLAPENMPAAKEDAALLKGLAKVKIQTTWIPWTYGRLSTDSGYVAGINSPGWYHHLWTHPDRVSERWLTRVARLLRDEDLDASSAQTIEAVRLAETLAALRNRPLPGLPEMNEAIQAIFCFGSALPLQLIHTKLIVGEKLGKVPDSTPMVPLQQDLQREQKRLRLPPAASQEMLELDLRKENDLDRSRLLHRLNLLEIGWGAPQRAAGKGTFKEAWKLQWKPEFAVTVIECGVWGNTVREAASAFTRNTADKAKDLPTLTALIGRVFVADLPEAAEHVMRRLQTEAAVVSDVSHLMHALPPLTSVLRYGNVRQTDTEMVGRIVAGLVARICVGLPLACGSLNDEAAAEMFECIGGVHQAIALIQNAEHTSDWQDVLRKLADLPNLHGLIAGRSVRLLLEAGKFTSDDAGQRLSYALSTAADPQLAATWIEGFLKGNGIVLIHDETLWNVVDQWVSALKPDAFTQILPLLRRTFSTFPAPERRQMGERAKHAATSGPRLGVKSLPNNDEFDTARAEAALPLIKQLLGMD
jgi:hypothetical protein